MDTQDARNRSTAAAALVALAMFSAGCVALRPKDDQRLKIAGEAVDLANEVRQGSANPFEGMVANVGKVRLAQEKIAAIQQKDVEQAFYANLGGMTRQQVLSQLRTSLDVHLGSLKQARARVDAAAAQVRRDLDRQDSVSRVFDVSVKGHGLSDVLGSVQARIRELQSLQVDISKALVASEQLDPKVAGAKQFQAAQNLAARGTSYLDSVHKFLAGVQDDPQVKAGGQLLLRAGQEICQAEQRRLSEHRVYLETVRNLAQELEQRNALYFQNLMIPALAMVANESELEDLLRHIKKGLQGAGKSTSGSSNSEILGLIGVLEDDELTRQQITARQKLWCGSCGLSDFVSQSMSAPSRGDSSQASADAESDSPQGPPPVQGAAGSHSEPACCTKESASSDRGVEAMKLVASLGLLVLVEEPADRQALLTLAREEHLHALRLSEINSQERLDLAHQVAVALQIYYQDGITPAELAQGLLLGSQVLATAFIGTRL